MAETPYKVSDFNIANTTGNATIDTGDLRRQYNFGNRVSELNIQQDTLFRILSKLRKVPTDDPQWKITEERTSAHKRYAYVTGWRTWAGTGTVPTTGYTTATADITSLTPETAGSIFAVKMGTDYKSTGNIQNIFGQSTNEITIGDAGTAPIFFMENQMIKICTKSVHTDLVADDYIVCRIMSVATSGQYVYLGIKVIRALKTSANSILCSYTDASTPISETYSYAPGISAGGTLGILETMRTYVVGTAFNEGSGYPGTYIDKPYSTRLGYTQIFKTTSQMTGTAMATKLRFKSSEWARVWGDKLVQQKWDIGDSIYFSTIYAEDDGTQHTQGIVDFITNYGNVFSLDTTKNQDDFLEDMSIFMDPRYNSMSNCLYIVSTTYWNWLHKLGGYALNNIQLGDGTNGAAYTFDFSRRTNFLGAEIAQFSTLYGTMNVMRDIHLDGTPVKMLGVNLKNVAYRPLVGNGENRDTSVYPRVQSLETTGLDARVDLILTEAGVEITMPESHAIWT